MSNFFILFCILILCSYFIVILTINPVYSILNLILIIIGLALLLFNLEFEFLPYILLIVYIGAVLVLFLFLVMMININSFYIKKKKNVNYFYVVIFFKSFFFFQFIIYNLHNLFYLNLSTHSIFWITNLIQYKINDILLFSNILYTYFFINIILIALILLLTMIGSIALCLAKKINYD